MPGKFVLKKSGKGFRWNLHSKSGRVLATSEHYESRRAAMNGIEVVRKKARGAKFLDAADELENGATAKKRLKKATVKRAAKGATSKRTARAAVKGSGKKATSKRTGRKAPVRGAPRNPERRRRRDTSQGAVPSTRLGPP